VQGQATHRLNTGRAMALSDGLYYLLLTARSLAALDRPASPRSCCSQRRDQQHAQLFDCAAHYGGG
jgi:hypothetical protein